MFLRWMSVSFVSFFFAQAHAASEPIELLQRKPGQKQFLSLGYGGRFHRDAGLEGVALAAAASPKGGGSAERAEQESDVYKVGDEGSGLLFLLNTYRGLQVVRYTKGATDVEANLIGRVDATGNYPSDMYYLKDRKQLLILERVWFDYNQRGNYSEDQSRIVVYDVADPEHPKVSATIPFKGSFSDSRIVGDVLYVASRIQPNWSQDGRGRSRNANEMPKGVVLSFDLSQADIRSIDEAFLSERLDYQETMNILKVPLEDGTFRYYLAAATTQYGRTWSDYNSYVELVDITNERGQIQKPTMRFPVKGAVTKRSNIMIKNGMLIVVSNYAGSDGRNRNAVEAFVLPVDGTRTISQREYEYRKMWMERELANLPEGVNQEVEQQKLLSHSELGLRGVFVHKTVGQLIEKPIADFVDTRGSTDEMSAALQDVRVDGDLLYVFWVPRNNIDPLDLYRIGTSETGVQYLNRTYFDGWVQRSEPVMFNGKRYVVALGSVIPSDSESGDRRFQAIVFEMRERGKIVKPDIVAQITFSESNGWSDFNRQDKFFEIRFTGEGRGQILFSQSARVKDANHPNRERWAQGGKLIAFDLSHADSDPNKVLTEGAFVEGQGSWLRRTFTNPEIDRITTFSDKVLATFQAGDVMKSDGFVRATNFLELARNIRAYVRVGQGDHARGVQIVSQSPSFYSYERETHTELRIVAPEAPDAELSAGMQRLSLAGQYVSHFTLADGNLVVVTSEGSYLDQKWTTTYRLSVVENVATEPRLKQNALQWVVGQSDTFAGPALGMVGGIRPHRYNSGAQIFKLSDSDFIHVGSSEKVIRHIHLGADKTDLSEQPIVGLDGNSSGEVQYLDGKFFWFETEWVNPQPNLGVQRHNLIPLHLSDGKWIASAKINIPGKPLSLHNGVLISQDTWALDVIKQSDGEGDRRHDYYEFVEENGLVATFLGLNEAYLADTLKGQETWRVLPNGRLLTVKAPENPWGYYGEYYQDSDAVHRMIWVEFADGKFHMLTRGLRLSTQYQVGMGSIYHDPIDPGDSMMALSSWKGLRVVRWNEATRRPELVPIASSVDAKGCEYYLDNAHRWVPAESIHFSIGPNANTLELPMGLAGVRRLFLK